MSQHNEILLPEQKRYTRADFAALRAYLNKIPVEKISDLYYCEDDLELFGITRPSDMARRLERMRDELANRLIDSNPNLASSIQEARRHGRWSALAIDYLFKAAEENSTRPKLSDPVSFWFFQIASSRLKSDGINTLSDLMACIRIRGQGWFRPIPAIGSGKARIIVQWLIRHEKTLGTLPESHQSSSSLPVSAPSLLPLDPSNQHLIPLERMSIPSSHLDGTRGENRHPSFPLIAARHDLDAIRDYLYKHRAQDKTYRSYQKELERFLLWCIQERSKALSSVLVSDCEAYKNFLQDPPARWIGPRRARHSNEWRPFTGKLDPNSQRYAVRVLRGFFKWLIDMRYLSGNPWMGVKDPATPRTITPIQIDKALLSDLWFKLAGSNAILDLLCAEPEETLQVRYGPIRGWAKRHGFLGGQFRIARAALYLMGYSGLRREEVSYATRDKLIPSAGAEGLWEMDVLGKGNKWRTVYLPEVTIQALRAHWADRNLDFEYGLGEIPLLSPVVIPSTESAQQKHGESLPGWKGELLQGTPGKDAGYSPEGLYQIIKTSLKRIADDESLPLEAHERDQLQRITPHGFRHTFGTLTAAGDVPLDVLQRAMGHASLQTTTIYVQSEKKRSRAEMGKFFRGSR